MTLEAAALNLITPAVQAGFDGEDEIIEMATDYLIDEWPEEDPFRLEALVERLTRTALQAHLAAQATWVTPTDCDRLDAAFATLDQQGITARQNFACCQSCGHAEIRGEMPAAARGYTFYHQQDTEHVVADGTLFLAFSSVSKADEDDIAIGHEIVAALQEAGLTVEWNGSFRSRILVKNLDWKKRR